MAVLLSILQKSILLFVHIASGRWCRALARSALASPGKGRWLSVSETGGVCPSPEQKPLSQICRFRSAAKSASSPFRGALGKTFGVYHSTNRPIPERFRRLVAAPTGAHLQNASPEVRGGILKWGDYAAFFAAFFFFSSQRTTTASSITAAAAQTLTLTVVKSRVMLSKPSSSTMAVGST